MRSHLKVKVYSLSTEMTYIRRQEEKWKNKARYARQKSLNHVSQAYAEQAFWSHHAHRHDLKSEARSTHLAYGCMKGVPYSSMEVICYGALKGYGGQEPNWNAISSMVERFSKDELNPQDIMQRFSEWLAEAKIWYEANPERIKAMWAEQKAKVWPPKKPYDPGRPVPHHGSGPDNQ